jgi:inorganic triphosphatase YgiF
MTTDHLEVERKFDADPGFVMPDLSVVPGCASVDGPVTHHLAATYYDTADQLLAASKITLRRRTGGTDAGWHLKLPAGQDTRRELHEPLGDDQVPGRLASLVADVTSGAPLAPIAVLETERGVRALLTAAGQTIAEVADDTVSARRTGSGQPPLTWREIEIEAGPAVTAAAFDAAARLLTSSGARPAASASKLARVLSR